MELAEIKYIFMCPVIQKNDKEIIRFFRFRLDPIPVKSSSAAKTCHFQHKPEGGIRDALPGSGVGLRAIAGRVSADRSMCTVVFRLNL
jgi:hypothetical protein